MFSFSHSLISLVTLLLSFFATSVSSLPIGNRLVRASEVSSSELFPVKPLQSWTTSPGQDGALPLSDSTLNPFKSDNLSKYAKAPDGQLSLEAVYPKGTFRLVKNSAGKVGGFSFYSHGASSVDLSDAKEVTFSYTTYFPKGFSWAKGGKLPGLYGGDDEDVAISCSGGRRDDACWSVRYMWRANGAGEVYSYLPPDEKANQKVCNVPPFSECNPTYGASIGRGSFDFKDGGRTLITQRVKLNDIGKENGELEMWVDGKSLINLDGLVYRTSSEGRVRGIQFQTFFGGHDSSFATPEDQEVFFSDFSLAVTEKL
ncbi:polysaccharide lyase family 14 protein [Abortiporus biennis]|nr:polysaccharide lyase family 14 protein [Abortiporus biennis]